MRICELGNPSARTVLVQMVDEGSLAFLDEQVRRIRQLTDSEFRLMAGVVDNWNRDLSPWAAPAVAGREAFGGGAEETLSELLRLCTGPAGTTWFLGGYSLAGLFALWAAARTDRFAGIAAASPSVWFPGFIDDLHSRSLRTCAVYLSLGDREEKTRNPVMSRVGECIRDAADYLRKEGICCVLEMNPGNHFRDVQMRMARGFAWLLNRESPQGGV